MPHRLIILVILTGLSVLPQAGFARDPGAYPDAVDIPATDTYAPDFTLNDINGNLIDFSESLGRAPVVLAFWSLYCDPCVEGMIALQKLEEKYQGQGLTIMAINEDSSISTERVGRFLERLEKFRGNITYPVLLDTDSRVYDKFGIRHLPAIVTIGRDGRVAGYLSGFNPEDLRDLTSMIEKTVLSAYTGEDDRTAPEECVHVITVTGEASLCGFYEAGTWRKGFTGSDSLQQEIALTRDVARRDASRRSIISALRGLGMVLYSNRPRRECLDGGGIHLARDPLETADPLSNLMARIDYSAFFETESEEDRLIDTTYYSTRTVRVHTERLSEELSSLGYITEPLRITFTYVNMGPLDRKIFLNTLLKQSMFIGTIEDPVITSRLTSQTVEVYTTSNNFADEITAMDFGDLKVFIEEGRDSSLEIEAW